LQVGELLRGYGSVVDRLIRAALSIVSNLSDGFGQFTRPDRRNLFSIDDPVLKASPGTSLS